MQSADYFGLFLFYFDFNVIYFCFFSICFVFFWFISSIFSVCLMFPVNLLSFWSFGTGLLQNRPVLVSVWFCWFICFVVQPVCV